MNNYLQFNNHMLLHPTNSSKYFSGIIDPINLPNLTIRVEFSQGYTPNQGISRTQVSSNPNVWDITVDIEGFMLLFSRNEYLLKVLACNTYGPEGYEMFLGQMCGFCPNLTNVSWFNLSNARECGRMFEGCEKITSLPEFSFDRSVQSDTSDLDLANFCAETKITSVNFRNCRPKWSAYMFRGCSELLYGPDIDLSLSIEAFSMFTDCTKLRSTPDYDIHSANNINYMYENCTSLTTIPDLTLSPNLTHCVMTFCECRNVSGGILRMYNKLKNISTLTDHGSCFHNCGVDSPTGAAELAQIPSDWK